jgi:hypothetical protein
MSHVEANGEEKGSGAMSESGRRGLGEGKGWEGKGNKTTILSAE